jgi:hypothetical protein
MHCALRVRRASTFCEVKKWTKLLVESETRLDPKIELRTSEAWGRLLAAVKAPTGPPKKRGVRHRRPGLETATAGHSITSAAAGQAATA